MKLKDRDSFLWFFGRSSCMKSASCEYRNKSACREEPIGMPAVCWKTRPPNIANMLSIKKSSMLMISVSENCLVASEWFVLQNKISSFLAQIICTYVGHSVYSEELVVSFLAITCIYLCLWNQKEIGRLSCSNDVVN